MNNKKYAEFIESYAQFCKKAGIGEYNGIYGFVRHEVKGDLKAKGKDKYEIDIFAETVAKDICKRLKIKY